MSATPPPLPFGDPSNINRQNAAASRKGVWLGCGIAAAIVGVLVLIGAGVFGMVIFAMHHSDAYEVALKAAQSSPVLKQELGEPITAGWFFSGNVSTTNDEGEADITLPVRGPAGAAGVHVVGTRKKGVWHYSEITATVEKSGREVDLR